jgi:acetylornithine/succinyldiaminopimelate/putrescine aminotransferase
MFYDFDTDKSEAIAFAAACREAGAKSAIAVPNNYHGRKTVQVKVAKADEAIASTLWDARIDAMQFGDVSENRPTVKAAKKAKL